MNEMLEYYTRLVAGMGVEGLSIPTTCVKFYFQGEPIPTAVREYETHNVTFTSCQANRQASLGDALLLTRSNIGCIAAAITFGLVSPSQNTAMEGSRVYTDIMKDQSGHASTFRPPTPSDFTQGLVYAAADAGIPDFCLFGPEDSGRFHDVETAKKAIADMVALQPARTEGVFFYSPEFDEADVRPDVVTMDVRPVELTRIVQAYQFLTGERVTGNMGPVRVVNSDLIVRPYLEGTMNFSSYCVGARLIGQYDANRLGLGIPYSLFPTLVDGMEKSKQGYPFWLYPGAKEG